MTRGRSHAGVLHYLRRWKALGGNPHDGAKVVAKMKELRPTIRCRQGPVCAPTGRRIIPAYLFEVKKPEEVEGTVGLTTS